MSRRRRVGVMPLEPTYFTEWRRSRGLTLEAVGKMMNLDKTALSKMERGITPYDQIHLQQLRDIYRVTIPDLLFTDPRRQSSKNQLGSVGFTIAPGAKKKIKGNETADELAEVLTKVRTPEEIDAVKMLVEALIARRK